MKIFLWLAVIVGGLAVMLADAEYEKVFECAGESRSAGNAVRTEAFLKFRDYRWYIFWMRGQGLVNIELLEPLSYVIYETTPVADDFIQFRELGGASFLGGFTKLSNSVTFKISDLTFDGRCTPRS